MPDLTPEDEPSGTLAGIPPRDSAAAHGADPAPGPALPADPPADPVSPTGLPGGPRLGTWLVVLSLTGLISVVFNLQEAGFLVVLSGLFVAAQAADLYPQQRQLYWALTWTVPVIGAAVFTLFAVIVSRMDPLPLQMIVVAVSAMSALVSLLTMFRPFSDTLARALFRDQPPSHALRLAARIVLMGLMLAFPGWYAFRDTFEQLFSDPSALFDQGFLGSGLIGYVVLALASVGYMVRRNLPDTLERLGIRALRPIDYAIVPVGVVLLFGVNLALETIQRTWFPGMWASDQRVSQLIAAGLGPGQMIMLGLSAGIGEEVTLRGALQPRLGLVLTSMLFAALHIQYSWFGMGVIFCFGLLLGFLRNRTSTTVVMAIHTLYDVAAVATMPGPT
jgi:hypothetical protein